MTNALLPRPRVPFIPAEPYARALSWLEGTGQDRDAMLDGSGIMLSQLEHPDGLLTLEQVETFVRNAATAMGEPGRAVEFGSGLLLPSHGVIGFAALTAPDVRAALSVAENYLELVTPLFVVEREDVDESMELRLLPRYRMDPIVLQVHLRVVASSLSVAATHSIGRVPPGVQVRLPDNQQRLIEWLRDVGVTVVPGGELVVMRFPKKALDLPFMLGDARVHATALERCKEMLAARRPQEQTIRDVRRVLRDHGPPFPDLEATSRQVGVSSRTLRRKLKAEGASFSELLEEARLSLAARLLSRSDREVTAIAYDLGYSNPANFTRAFGRALGMTPTAYRRDYLAGRLSG